MATPILKLCAHCGVEKPLEQFGKRTDTPGGRRGKCKQCFNAATANRRAAEDTDTRVSLKAYHRKKSKEWYQRTKSSAPEKLTERHRYVAVRRRAAKADWVKRLGGACAHCGGAFPDCVFEFHHVNGDEKDYSPSHLFHLAPATIEAEMQKCIMLCANCHRIEHEKLKYADHAKRVLKGGAEEEKPEPSERKGPGGRFRCQYRIGEFVFKTQAEAARFFGVSGGLISIRVNEKDSKWVREMVYEV